MVTETDTFKAWMPIQKQANGGFIGILSDTSIDRDEEFMTKELLESWAQESKSLPMLANHENKMEKFIGGWKNKQIVSNGSKHALTAEPFFFSKEANPLAAQIKKQVEEALAQGLNVGISISAIVKEVTDQKIDGELKRGFAKAEIVEATVVPVQSNRGAGFTAIAKSFNINNKTGENMELTQKDIDLAVEKKASEYSEKIATFEKQLGEKDSEIVKLKKDVEDSEKAKDEAETKTEEAEKKVADAEEVAEKAKKESLEKQRIADEAGNGEGNEPEDVDKSFNDGKVPIMRT